jgi:adenine-specific DNA methylase
MDRFEDLFTPRQALALTTLTRLVQEVGKKVAAVLDEGLAVAVQTCLALALDKQADSNSSLCAWRASSQDIGHTFGRQALPMVWDFVEGNILSGATRDWSNAVEGGLKAIQSLDENIECGHAECCSAGRVPIPDDAAQAFVTDPPYYDAVPYADLSDFFIAWLKRSLGSLFSEIMTDSYKDDECIVDEVKYKTREYYERTMTEAMSNGRRILIPEGVAVVVFANKTTSGWEALLNAMIEAGWVITGSWPIDTEMGSRLRAMNSAALASSIHLVCRPRENPDGSPRTDDIGDWRDVLQELPNRIHDWMPRLAQEGIVGADAIFSCLGPALEIFSRYSRVEKASGEQVTLKEYLEHVWAAVAKEALNVIFKGADATGFEEDARLTAMWLWTLSTGTNGNGKRSDETDTQEDEEVEEPIKKTKMSGFVLEYDAARKIAQGLGAHLEHLATVVEVKGDKARLLPVSERAKYLFVVKRPETRIQKDKKRSEADQNFLFEMPAPTEAEPSESAQRSPDLEMSGGKTVLDRVHQSMLLFASGRGEALKRFLVEDAAGQDPRFWRLAQALSALYPVGTEEKRWVDGVFGRKKGLGL